jgi:uncharacterized membrane protein
MARRSDERGAVALMTALFLVVIVGVAALAVDLGMQRVSKRDMQALSDVVALDMARQLNGSTAAVLTSSPTWASEFTASKNRNGGQLGSSPVVTIEVGKLDPATRVFTPMANDANLPTDVPDAVRVTSSTSVSFAFHTGSGGVVASSVAAAVKTACFKLGSYAARFNSGDSSLISTLVDPMNQLVRPQANLDAASYQGIASTTVSINELVSTGQVGTVDQLLGSTVTLGNLLQATATALGRQTPPNSVAISALNKILNGQANLSGSIRLSNVLNVSPTDSAALATRFNVLDLVTGAVLVADGQHGVTVPNLAAGINNLAPATASGYIIEAPQVGCGIPGSATARASTAQLHVDATLNLQAQSINLGGSGVVQTPQSAVVLAVNLGSAQGQLTLPGPVCNAGTTASPDTETVSVSTGLTTMTLNTTLHFAATVHVTIAGLDVPLDVTFDQTAAAAQPTGSPGSASLAVPPNDVTPVSTGSPAPFGDFTIASTASNVHVSTSVAGQTQSALDGLATTAINGSGGLASQLAVNAALLQPLNLLVGNVNGLVVPYEKLLGLRLAGADVWAVNRPVCNGAALRG